MFVELEDSARFWHWLKILLNEIGSRCGSVERQLLGLPEHIPIMISKIKLEPNFMHGVDTAVTDSGDEGGRGGAVFTACHYPGLMRSSQSRWLHT